MANTPDVDSGFVPVEDGDKLLPLSPFYSLSYHFGMLLGVDDFETEQAYHRAKMRLHNAWLHREGVVWGFGVRLETERGEVRVLKGLALDAAGHELHLEGDACVNIGQWFAAHKDDADFKTNTIGTTDTTNTIGTTGATATRLRFNAYVCIRFKACLTRQVPAMLEPCDNASSNGTAYSRVFETVEILLRPGRAPEKARPYHRLRLLFGLEDAQKDGGGVVTAGDQEVLDARAAVQALPADKRPAGLMRAFHRFAALDEIDLQPQKSPDGERLLLFPGAEDEPVVLAQLTDITLEQRDDKWVLTGGRVDTSVRPSHVATTTIQDLLCGPLFGAGEGPRVVPDSVVLLTDRAIEFRVDKGLLDASVKPAAFSVTWLDPDKDADRGWRRAHIQTAAYGGDETKAINLELRSAVSGHVRLIVYGTGPAPLLGADFVPLAGGVGGPAGTAHDGHDFVHMQEFKRGEVRSVTEEL